LKYVEPISWSKPASTLAGYCVGTRRSSHSLVDTTSMPLRFMTRRNSLRDRSVGFARIIFCMPAHAPLHATSILHGIPARHAGMHTTCSMPSMITACPQHTQHPSRSTTAHSLLLSQQKPHTSPCTTSGVSTSMACIQLMHTQAAQHAQTHMHDMHDAHGSALQDCAAPCTELGLCRGACLMR
jgi:hypothetical protein